MIYRFAYQFRNTGAGGRRKAVLLRPAIPIVLAYLLSCAPPWQPGPVGPSVVPMPTVTPEPTPMSVPVSMSGIGVSRDAIQSLFERAGIDFTFQTLTPVQNQPRVLGKSEDGLSIIELIGPPSNLTQASFILANDANSKYVMAYQFALIRFFELAVPALEDGKPHATWLYENTEQAIKHGSVKVLDGHHEIEYKVEPNASGSHTQILVIKGK